MSRCHTTERGGRTTNLDGDTPDRAPLINSTRRTLGIRRALLIALALAGLLLAVVLREGEAQPAVGPAHVRIDISEVSLSVHHGPAQPWPQFRYFPGHSGFNPLERTLTPENVSELTRRWAAQLGGAVLVSSPAVADGRVFVGAHDSRLYAVDADTGEVAWDADTPFPADYGSPAYARGRVYITSTDGLRGALQAFDATSGRELWRVDLGFSESSPVVVRGRVFVAAETRVLALHPVSGEVVWSRDIAAHQSSPALANGRLYISGDDGTLYALNAADGAGLWQVPGEGIGGLSSPAVVAGVVYASLGGGSEGSVFGAFDARTGEEQWRTELGFVSSVSPAVAQARVYVGTASMHGSVSTLHILDASTGATACSAPIDGVDASAPSVANGVVYLGTLDQELHAIDATDCGVLATLPLAAVVESSPAIAAGVVYVGAGPRLYAFGLP